jgi:predicted amidohydrolase YtcJ
LFDAGVIVAGGSDHMIRFDARQAVNPYHPFFGMWMAITRKTVDGSVINPEQRISREGSRCGCGRSIALISPLKSGAKGSIEPGKLADLVMISQIFSRARWMKSKTSKRC